jgi:hypothetical protein
MEMPPDTLETVEINDLFVALGVDTSFTTEQAASGSSGTHRVISSNSNTESISSILSVNSGAVSLIVLKRGSSIAPNLAKLWVLRYRERPDSIDDPLNHSDISGELLLT